MTKWISERNIAVALALLRTLWCAWRAATQSLVHDEAQTFITFLNGSWHDVYFHFTSNNHVLYSLLAKVSITLFGVSEFTLRLPTVIAGFFLMLGFWRVLEHSPSRSARWIAFATLALNPPMLDFSVAARGYGLSLALLIWALYAAMKARPAIAGLLLGLSVSANLTAALLAAGLIAAVALLAEGSLAVRVRTVAAMVLAFAASLGLVYGGVLGLVERREFYAGEQAFAGSLLNLVMTSIHATPRQGLLDPARTLNALVFVALPVIGLFILAGAYLAWRSGDRITPLAPLALVLALMAIVAAHHTMGLLYPVDRTGLPWMLMFAVAWAMVAGITGNLWLRRVNLLAASLLAAQFLTQFHSDYLTIWWYDRFTKEVAHRIESETRDRPAGSVSISSTWIQQPALEFYRVHDRVSAWKPVERFPSAPLAGYDYYVLNQPDTDSPEARALTVLFSDPFSGVVLAR